MRSDTYSQPTKYRKQVSSRCLLFLCSEFKNKKQTPEYGACLMVIELVKTMNYMI